jgi:hypothetical protein
VILYVIDIKLFKLLFIAVTNNFRLSRPGAMGRSVCCGALARSAPQQSVPKGTKEPLSQTSYAGSCNLWTTLRCRSPF